MIYKVFKNKCQIVTKQTKNLQAYHETFKKIHEKKVVTRLICMILYTIQADYIRAKND